MEIGLYKGSTFFSVLEGVKNIIAIGIDSWVNGFLNVENMDEVYTTFIREAETYIDIDAVVETTTTTSSATESESILKGNHIRIIRHDCFNVSVDTVYELTKQNKVNIYFYDAGHTVWDQYMALVHYYYILEETFIYIVDDWDDMDVQEGTYNAISILYLK